MSASVGNLKVVHTEFLIIPDGEVGRVSFVVGGWNVNLEFTFKIEPNTVAQGGVLYLPQPETATFQFVNWRNPLGTAILQPFAFGNVASGDQIFIMAAHTLVGSLNCLHVQFLMGRK